MLLVPKFLVNPDGSLGGRNGVYARFFAATVLPRLATERQIAEDTTLDLMELPEGAF
jgi:hypothetical protein